MQSVCGQRGPDGSIHIVLDNLPPFKHVFDVEWKTRRGISIRMTPHAAEELHRHLGELLADVSREDICESPERSEHHRRPIERNRWIFDLHFCGDCGGHVPVFRDLCPPEQAILESWLANRPHYPVVANETGLSDGLAKSWVLHGGRAPNSSGRWTSARCPNCDRWLRNPSAQQCFHCGADWHTSER